MIISIGTPRENMFNLKDRGVEYPIDPQEESDACSMSSRVEFACMEEYSNIYIPPVGATEHVTNRRKEFYFNKSFNEPTKKYVEHDDIEQAMSVGWLVPLQSFIKVKLDGPESCRQMPNQVNLRGLTPIRRPGSDTHDILVEIDLKWVPIVDDGISLLIKEPEFMLYEDFTVLPRIIDADNIPMTLRVTLLTTGPTKLNLDHGMPLVQVIPFNKELMRVETEILPPDEAEN